MPIFSVNREPLLLCPMGPYFRKKNFVQSEWKETNIFSSPFEFCHESHMGFLSSKRELFTYKGSLLTSG